MKRPARLQGRNSKNLWFFWAFVVRSIIGTLRNEDGNRQPPTTTAQKNHISGLLFTFLCGPLGFCFFALNFVNKKMIKCFAMKLNKYWDNFCCYVLVDPTTLKKVFSRCNFSDNFMQVLSSMHSNVQLLCLLLFFAVVVGVAVLVT